jgi:hypothetical protein
LGAIVLNETQATSISFQMLDAAWYRAHMAPFVKEANRKKPFFFAANPQSQPHEAAYAWFEEAAQPVFKPEFDAADISIQLRAVS